MLQRAPDDRGALRQLLRQAQDRALIDSEAAAMIEGVLQVAELSAGDIMVPRSQMDVIDISAPLQTLVPFVIRTAHSRFPVVDGDRDAVIGILHAKDLLRLQAGPGATLRELLRAPVFIPETKRLNVLLRDFRQNRNHLAIVVDEFGGVAGLITIEDVLEQIVGEIEDEFDLDAAGARIVEVAPSPEGGRRWRLHAQTPLAELNERFGLELDGSDADTIGGLVAARLGRVPRRGDRIGIGGLLIEVLRADPRAVRLLQVGIAPDAARAPDAGDRPH